MRAINAEGLELLARVQAGEQGIMVQLVQAELSPVQYLCTAGLPLRWAGQVWQPLGLEVSPVRHGADGEIEEMAFSLPGVTSDQLALALTESVEGKNVRVYDAIVDPATSEVADAVLAWAGTLNVPGLQDGPEASVSWTAEHRGVQAYRIKPRRYNNEEQLRRYAGDTCFDFDPATDAAELVWPAASYFKK